MKIFRITLAIIFLNIIQIELFSFGEQNNDNPHITSVSFISPNKVIKPGDSFSTLLTFEFSKGAHSYWINNGDTGMPPDIRFDITEGVTLTNTTYQIPHIFSNGGIVDYGFEHSMSVLCSFVLDNNFKGNSVDIKVNAVLLVCDTKCVPDSAKASLSFPVRKSNTDILPDWETMAKIENIIEEMPEKIDAKAKAYEFEDGLRIEMILPSNPSQNLYFFPFQDGIFANEKIQKQEKKKDKVIIYLKKGAYFSEYPENLSGIVVAQEPWNIAGKDERALEIEIEYDNKSK